MEQEIGVILLKICQDALESNAGRDGIIILILILKNKDGQKIKTKLSSKHTKSKIYLI
jgi:hypothetical protein